MRHHAATLLALLAPTGCQTTGQDWTFPPESYLCTVERRVGDWQMRSIRIVMVDPTLEGWDEVHWDFTRAGPGVNPSIQWVVTAAGREVRAFRLFYSTATNPRGKVRVEIRRAEPTGSGPEALTGAGDYYRSHRSRGNSLYRRQGDFNWEGVQALVREGTSMMVVLAGQDGQDRGAIPFQPSWLTPPEEAVAEARPELEAMAADYRNRCTPEPPIIVT